MEKFDYGIIGGGPAGYTAGINLAKQGYSVILFEKNKLGGTCLNAGCIPTKSMLHSAENSIDFHRAIEKKNQAVDKVRKALELAVKNSGIKTIYAEAQIQDKNTIIAEGQEYKADKIIVAAGSKPREIKGLEFDGNFILNSNNILNLSELPQNVLIVGSGAIGIEWARIFSRFGSQVILVEMAEHLIPLADIEISKRIERIFKQKGIQFYLNNFVEKIENKTAFLSNGIKIEPDIILVAVGRTPISLANTHYAKLLGDSCGEIQLAHYAIHQAKEYTLNIPFDRTLVPSVIYGEPEIAWVGMREQDTDDSYTKALLPITALGKAWCDESTDGFIKLITKNNQIYGAHIISKEASSLIHILLIAIQKHISINELQEICFAHPTYAEGIFELACRI